MPRNDHTIMPIYIVTSGHSPSNCPIHNEKARKMFLESATKLGELTKKHGIKVLGNYGVIPEHKNYLIVEANSADAFQKAMNEPDMIKWLGYNMTEIKLAIPTDEVIKMLKQL